MGRFVTLIGLALVVAVLALLGQASGMYDVAVLRDIRALIPFAQPTSVSVEPPPGPSPTAVTARQVPASQVPTTNQACAAGAPRFVLGAATLKAALGAAMGEPLECERVVDASGD